MSIKDKIKDAFAEPVAYWKQCWDWGAGNAEKAKEKQRKIFKKHDK